MAVTLAAKLGKIFIIFIIIFIIHVYNNGYDYYMFKWFQQNLVE